MHYVRVLFYIHKFAHPYPAGFRNPSQIIPSQIHQHQVFCLFLCVVNQFVLKPFILYWRFSAGAGAGNRPGLHQAFFAAHQHFRGGPD